MISTGLCIGPALVIQSRLSTYTSRIVIKHCLKFLPEERQQEVELFIDLWLGVSDVALEVTVAIVATLVEEGVHFLIADLIQPVRGHDVGGLIFIALLPICRGLSRIKGVCNKIFLLKVFISIFSSYKER